MRTTAEGLPHHGLRGRTGHRLRLRWVDLETSGSSEAPVLVTNLGTDLTETDRLRNIDRRCLKEAQGWAIRWVIVTSGLPMTELDAPKLN